MKLFRWLTVLAALFVSGAPVVFPAVSEEVMPVKKTALITIPVQIELKAPPARVWAVITSAKGFATLTGFTPDETDASTSFTRVGESMSARVWKDSGRLFATYVAPGRELRVTWEPANGSYLCGKRILIQASGGGTMMQYWDRYSDDQPNADETAKQVREETVKAVAAFRALVEKK